MKRARLAVTTVAVARLLVAICILTHSPLLTLHPGWTITGAVERQSPVLLRVAGARLWSILNLHLGCLTAVFKVTVTGRLTTLALGTFIFTVPPKTPASSRVATEAG